MKKYLNLSLCLLVALGMASCEADDIREEPRSLGGYASLADSEVSVFDTNEQLTIEFFTAEGVTPETVEIVQDGEVVGTATVSGETATFNTSIFAPFEFTDDDGVVHPTGAYSFKIRTTYSNGSVSVDPFHLSVVHAISLGDNPTETTRDSLAERKLKYTVSTFAAPVDDVTLAVKENEAGTFMETGIDLSTVEDSVAISEIDLAGMGINLETNDTLFYKFTATSGAMTDVAQDYLAVVPKEFQTSASATISSDTTANQVNLATGEVTADGEPGADIAFTEDLAGQPGFTATSDSDVMFVEVSNDAEYWASANVLNAKELYEAGTPTSTITNVQQGDVVVYKVSREVEVEEGVFETLVYYGALRIGDVAVVNNEVVNFEIESMEGR